MTRPRSPVSIELNARETAIAWLNAFFACSQNDERPTLYRTVSLEVFRTGVQFISTNGHALLRTWAPLFDRIAGMAPAPEPDEVPECEVVVADADHFGKAFLTTILAATGGKDNPNAFAPLRLELAPLDQPHAPALSEELTPWTVRLTTLGQELQLRMHEDEYPNWRALDLGLSDVQRVDGLDVAPQMFSLIGKLRAVHRVSLTFRGDRRAILVHAHGDLDVHGLLMPMARDRAANADDDTTDAAPETALDGWSDDTHTGASSEPTANAPAKAEASEAATA